MIMARSILARSYNPSNLDISTFMNDPDASLLYNEKLIKLRVLARAGESTVLIDTNLATIAKEVYGNANYSWIIAIYNGITDDDIYPGMVLYYPDIESVKLILK